MMRARVLIACAACVAGAVTVITAACAPTRSETYGFIAMLGDDTTSVERVVRTADRVTSDAVGRSPVVTRRHWEARLAPDGTVREWSMDTFIPNADSGKNHIRHTARFTDREIQLSRRTSRDTTFAYVRRFPVNVPWNAFVYGTYELLVAAARTRGDSARVGQYFFEGWDEGHVGYADVRRVDSATYSIQSTGLAGTGIAHIRADGRLLSYSGEGTTYKQEVRRLEQPPDIDAIAARFAAEEKRAGVARALSIHDIALGRIGNVDVSVDYSRPLRRGRTLVGALIPYDEVWRTGANAATQLSVSGSVQLDGVRLGAGAYTLWTLPSRHGVQLVINRQTGQWGTGYRAEYDIARVPMTVDSTQSNVERFTIRIEADSARTQDKGRLVMEWGTFRWSAPIAVIR